MLKLAFIFMLIIATFGYIPPGILESFLHSPALLTGTGTSFVNLWVDQFTREKPGWRKIGTEPWLNSAGPGEPPAAYINSSMAYEACGYFCFQNLTGLAISVVNVTVQIYMRTTFFMGYVEPYLNNGTADYDLGEWHSLDAYIWQTLDVTAYCPTPSAVNATKIYFDSGAYGGAGMGSEVDAALLKVCYTHPAPEASNISYSSTVSGSNCTFSSKWRGIGLDKAYFVWNGTWLGEWEGSPLTDPWVGSPDTGWFNITKALPLFPGRTVGWYFSVSDTRGWGDSNVSYLTIVDYGTWQRINFTSCNYTTAGPDVWQDVYTSGMYVGSGWQENTMTHSSMTRWVRLDIMQTQDANFSLVVYEVQFYDAQISSYKSGVTVYAACGNDTGHISTAALDNNTATWWRHNLQVSGSHTLIVDCGSFINLTKVRFFLKSSEPKSQINMINIYTTGSWATYGTSPWINATGYPMNCISTSSSHAVCGNFKLQPVPNLSYLWVEAAMFEFNLSKAAPTTNVTFQYYSPDPDWYPHTWTGDSYNSSAIGWQAGNVSLSVLPVGSHLTNFTMRILNTGASNVIIDHVSLLVKTWTLADRLRFYASLASLDWTSEYFGLVLGMTTKTGFGNYIDSLAANGKWVDVIQWSVRAKKLGIEREAAIRNALGNISTVLKYLPSRDGGPVFSVYSRDLLYGCLFYSAKYNYLTTKWNATAAYNTFRNECQSHKGGYGGDPALLDISNDSSVFSSRRFYDENAETIGCYLVFYSLNVTKALDDAIEVWNWVNNNHWNETWQYYRYLPTSEDPLFECEAAFFLKIIALLEYYSPQVENTSRLYVDSFNRFLRNRWLSYQWLASSDNTKFCCVHAYDGNPESRLQNDLGSCGRFWASIRF